MNKIVFLYSFLTLLSIHSIAQRKNLVKTNIGRLALLGANVAYERMLSPRLGLHTQASASYHGYPEESSNFGYYKGLYRENFKAFVTSVDLKWYRFKDTAKVFPHGVFWSVGAGYRYADYTYESEVRYEGRISVGYQKVFNKRWMLETSAGISYGQKSVQYKYRSNNLYSKNYRALSSSYDLNLSIGYLF